MSKDMTVTYNKPMKGTEVPITYKVSELWINSETTLEEYINGLNFEEHIDGLNKKISDLEQKISNQAWELYSQQYYR